MAVFKSGALTDVCIWACDLRVEPERFGEIAAFFGCCRTERKEWDVLVCEVPEIYPHTPNPKDVLAVTMVAGALCTIPAKKVCTYLPKTWKGQVPKKIHHERLLTEVTASERVVLDAAKKKYKGLFHNAMDAIGLGIWYLQKNHGRIKHP